MLTVIVLIYILAVGYVLSRSIRSCRRPERGQLASPDELVVLGGFFLLALLVLGLINL